MRTTPELVELSQSLQRQLELDQLVLPSLPENALQARQQASDRRSTLKQIADAIAADPAMASQLMRLAQTLRYSHPGQPITSLPIAIARIGLQGTVNVAMALAVHQLFHFHAPQIRQLCRSIQQKAVHVSRFALTLSDEFTPEHTHQLADFIVLASVLLDIGCLPLLAELDHRVAQGESLPDTATLTDWCAQLRVPLGLAMLKKWRLDPSFAELLPLTRTPANSPAAEALILAHAYYEAQSLVETRERNELAVELALHPLDSDEERQQLLAWLHQQPEAMVIN